MVSFSSQQARESRDQSGPASTTGRSFPIGATLATGGATFSVFSRSAARIALLLFDRVDDACPSRVIPIDPLASRTYHYWHVFVSGVQAGQIYGFRANGPFEPDRGLRFDPSKLLLGPYGRAIVVPRNYSRETARREGDNTATLCSRCEQAGGYFFLRLFNCACQLTLVFLQSIFEKQQHIISEREF